MGLKANWGSAIEFTDHGPGQPAKGMRWVEPSLEYDYSVRIEFDPKAPKPPTPKQDENWRIGIVQNVLFQSIRVQYTNMQPREKSWTKQLLDAFKGDQSALPFYAPPTPYLITTQVLGIQKKKTTWLRASVDATFGPNGFNVKPPPGTKPDSDVDQLSFHDHPRFSVPLNFRNNPKHVLMATSHLIAMRVWVLAIGPGGSGAPIILAESDPFTLAMWMKFPENVERGKAVDPTSPVWDAEKFAPDVIKGLPENYEKKGPNWDRFVNKYNRDAQFHSPGKHPPVLKGPLVNDEGSPWMQDNDLIPSVAD